MHFQQRGRVAPGVAAVDPARAAIAQKMLGGGNHMALVKEGPGADRPLQAFDHRRTQPRGQLWIFRKALVGPAPPGIAGYGNRGRKGPVDPGHGDFCRRCRPDGANQPRITRRAQRDIVREQGCAGDVAVAMHRIGGPKQRDCRLARIQRGGRGRPKAVGQRQPVLRRGLVIPARAAVAAVQHRAEAIATHVVRGHSRNVGLDQLGDLVLKAHCPQQCGDPAVDGIGGSGNRRCGGRCVGGTRNGAAHHQRTR